VIHDDDGKVEGVRYELLPALLLNEVRKLAKENQQKDARIAGLQRQIVAQQSRIGALQKESARIDMLTARLGALEKQARRTEPQRLVVAFR
jgi:hypothetical protein